MNYPGGHCQGWQIQLGSLSQPPANKQPYQTAGPEPPSPMDRIYPSLLAALSEKGQHTPLGEGGGETEHKSTAGNYYSAEKLGLGL